MTSFSVVFSYNSDAFCTNTVEKDAEPYTCNNVHPNCVLCPTATSCFRCQDEWTLINNTCVAECTDIPRCSKCILPNVCGECEEGFQLVDNQCKYGCSLIHPNCTECNGTVCTECEGSSELINGTCYHSSCHSDDPFCLDCIVSNACILCQNGYEIVNSRCADPHCISDDSNCLNCTNKSTCVYCQSGYNLGNGKCICSPTDSTLCLECSSPDVCTRCLNGYAANNKGRCVCVPNDSNCSICSSPDFCIECKTGYVFSDDNQSCILPPIPGECGKPILGCINCSYSGSNKCVECDSISHFVLQDGRCSCNSDEGYILIGNKCEKTEFSECGPSIVNCTQCVGTGESQRCISCDLDFGLENGTCVKCEEGRYVSSDLPCATQCQNVSDCKFCVQSFDDSYICSQCNDQYELDKNTSTCVCVPNNGNCVSCNAPDNCTECKEGYDLSNGTCVCVPTDSTLCVSCSSPDVCTECKQGYSISNGRCVCIPNDDNCNECSSPDVCTECKEGYFLDGNRCRENRNCSPYVLNCEDCDPNDNKICIKCNNNYGLRGGSCSLCTGNYKYVSSISPCQLDCSVIQNCDDDTESCVVENGLILCLECKSGYVLSSNKQSCVLATPGECGITIPGCVKCAYEGSDECVECDSSNHFVLDDGICSCNNDEGYVFVGNKCKKTDFIECGPDADNCQQCVGTSESQRCIACDYQYGLENDRCVKCEEGRYLSSNLPCATECKNVPNCKFCTQIIEDSYVCTQCNDQYEFDEDTQACINKTKVSCNVVGCALCYQENLDYCIECNELLHFEKSLSHPGSCVCNINYDFFNGQCIFPVGPITPEELPTIDINASDKKYVTVTDEKIELKPDQFPSSENEAVGSLYNIPVPENVNTVTVPTTNKVIQLTIPEKVSSPITINAAKSSKPLIVDCPKGATLVIPEDNNMDLKGSGIITIDSSNKDSAQATINKVTLDKPGDQQMKLESATNIEINEMQIFGQKMFVGQEGSTAKTKCRTLKIEGGGEFEPQSVSFDTAKIGFKSIFKVKSNVEVSHFQIHYNMSQAYHQIIPTLFTYPFPSLDSTDVQIFMISQGATLQEDENFTISQFVGESEEKNKEACQKLNYIKGNSGFDTASCVKADTKGSYYYVATKVTGFDIPNGGGSGSDNSDNEEDDGKGGLGGGAIAGIVIACLVVVAVAIVLVSFFVIKKKKSNSNAEASENIDDINE